MNNKHLVKLQTCWSGDISFAISRKSLRKLNIKPHRFFKLSNISLSIILGGMIKVALLINNYHIFVYILFNTFALAFRTALLSIFYTCKFLISLRTLPLHNSAALGISISKTAHLMVWTPWEESKLLFLFHCCLKYQF